MFGDNKVRPLDDEMPVAVAAVAHESAPPVAEMTADGGLPVAQGTVLDAGPWATLAHTNRYRIIQHPQKLEALAQMCCAGCFEMQNQYSVFDAETQVHLLEVKEKSEMCERMCCSPQHSLVLLAFDAREGVPENTLVFSARKDLRFFNCFSCVDFCRGRLDVFNAQGEPVGHVQEPTCMAAGCSPKLEMMDRDASEPFMRAEGPTWCIGGCMELCTDITFRLVNPEDKGDHAQVGQIVKEAPKDFCQMLQEASTQADRFLVEFPASETEEHRALILANAFLADYMFFESGNLVRRKGTQTEIHCANCYCFGCLFPVVTTLGGNN
ncbi:Phospholipid scramblase 1 [Hondaea fermentalgiana]|uniref:Phospholipid scramblase n=1 Tax=Hondaea fermentalgiana TaxID=2315210 RepID=A0A2R5G1V0_9STRA|nr:Phospholipid scramblase 1 [Hondaea fermentalgiana]|eukprot:GBG24996.1 Phospholipid scramblase 1 [Hondaea fermentalgiana]